MVKKDIKNYNAVHQWLRYRFGSAKLCENPDCPKISQNYSWAKKKGKRYIRKRDNFLQLCYSCHGKYDVTAKKRRLMSKLSLNRRKTHCKHGHPFDKENTYRQKLKDGTFTRRCRQCVSKRKKLWVTKNAERVRNVNKEWKKRNPDKVRATAYGFLKRHPDYLRKKDGRWIRNGKKVVSYPLNKKSPLNNS